MQIITCVHTSSAPALALHLQEEPVNLPLWLNPPLHLLCPSRIYAALSDGEKDIITPLSSLSIHNHQLRAGLSCSWGLTTHPGAIYSAPWAGGD